MLAAEVQEMQSGLAQLRLESKFAQLQLLLRDSGFHTIQELDLPLSDRTVWQIQPLLVMTGEGAPAHPDHWSAPSQIFVGSAAWK